MAVIPPEAPSMLCFVGLLICFVRLSWLAREPPGSHLSPPPNSGITYMCHHGWLVLFFQLGVWKPNWDLVLVWQVLYPLSFFLKLS